MAGANERTERNAMNGTATEGLASTLSQSDLDRRMRRRGEESRWWWIVPTLYIFVLLLPIYWLINMSFKTNAEIVNSLTLYPHQPTIANYLGRVTKPRILEAVEEARGEEMVHLIDHLKKGDMAKEAERLLEGTGWLPEEKMMLYY